jgi:uncharacterized membrane protein YdfJ with MMPL/SSD domain
MIFLLPIIIYLFVVAIGTDYNIQMIARLREKAKEGHNPRTAADLSVEHAGPSVAAAGLILAGTFASLIARRSGAAHPDGLRSLTGHRARGVRDVDFPGAEPDRAD